MRGESEMIENILLFSAGAVIGVIITLVTIAVIINFVDYKDKKEED